MYVILIPNIAKKYAPKYRLRSEVYSFLLSAFLSRSTAAAFAPSPDAAAVNLCAATAVRESEAKEAWTTASIAVVVVVTARCSGGPLQ